MRKHGVVCEARGDEMPAVHAGHVLIFFVAAALERFFDDGREVFIFADVLQLRVRADGCGEHAVGIALPHGHEAICGEQNRCRDIVELRLLVLPAGAEIAL